MTELDTTKRHPREWEEITGVTVHDPDGWDRQNWDVSWNTLIDEAEFVERAKHSTCTWGPKGGLYLKSFKG